MVGIQLLMLKIGLQIMCDAYDYDPKEKYYKNYLIMGKFFFKIHEAVWWIVAEIEDWLYPYYDRPVEDDPYDHNRSVDVNEAAYLRSQLEASRQNIERLQSEMIYMQSIVNTLTDKRKITIKPHDDEQN